MRRVKVILTYFKLYNGSEAEFSVTDDIHVEEKGEPWGLENAVEQQIKEWVSTNSEELPGWENFGYQYEQEAGPFTLLVEGPELSRFLIPDLWFGKDNGDAGVSIPYPQPATPADQLRNKLPSQS